MRKRNVRIFERQSVSDTNTDKLGICWQQCIFFNHSIHCITCITINVKESGAFLLCFFYILFFYVFCPPLHMFWTWMISVNFLSLLGTWTLNKATLCHNRGKAKYIYPLYAKLRYVFFLNPVLNPDYNFEQTLLRNTSPVLCLNKEIPGKSNELCVLLFHM